MIQKPRVLTAGTAILLTTLLSSAAVSSSQVSALHCFPPNKLHLNPSPHEKSNVSRMQFNAIIDKAEKIYAPVIRAQGGKLVFNRLWKDETVNASANQDGKTWTVNMYGGLARRPEVTPDGFAMVVCHELGHHLAGYSFYNEIERSWAANEGQSDYFATHSCAKEMWKDEPEVNARSREKVLPFAQQLCDMNYTQQADRDICYRASNGGLSLATLLAKLRESDAPKFETPDRSVVSETYDGHPEAQCRLDTYLAGAVCTVPFKKSVIPAKGVADQFGVEAESEAGRYSCLARDGWVSAQRPRCWFKPLLEFEGMIAQAPVWGDASGNRQAEPGETITLSIPLANNDKRTSEQVIGELFSRTAGVTVVRSKIGYPDITAGSTVNPEQAFELKIDKNFTCGHPFEVLFRASGKAGAREFTFEGLVGPRRSADLILGTSTKDIQIPDAPDTGVSIPITVKQKTFASELALDLEIEGNYPEENEFILRLPTGDEVPVPIGGIFTSSARATAFIKLPQRMPLQGSWALKIRDMQENDTLTLKSFRLRAPLAEQVTCLR